MNGKILLARSRQRKGRLRQRHYQTSYNKRQPLVQLLVQPEIAAAVAAYMTHNWMQAVCTTLRTHFPAVSKELAQANLARYLCDQLQLNATTNATSPILSLLLQPDVAQAVCNQLTTNSIQGTCRLLRENFPAVSITYEPLPFFVRAILVPASSYIF